MNGSRVGPRMASVRALDRVIHDRHLLKHPFYVAWAKGEVPIETLREYAAQYYHFERNFPRYVAGAYARIERPEDRKTLLDNLVDEEGRSPTHPELWLGFGRAIGLSSRAAKSGRPSVATQNLLSTYERHTLHGDAASALGALYAYESIFPEVAAEKSRGLKEMYGLRSKGAHEFFRVHTTADVAHSDAERRALESELRGSADARRSAERAVTETVDAWWGFLDSFCA